jgi:hypothetical protein
MRQSNDADRAGKSSVDLGFRSFRYGLEGAFVGVAVAGIVAMFLSAPDHARFDYWGALIGFFVVVVGRYFGRSDT